MKKDEDVAPWFIPQTWTPENTEVHLEVIKDELAPQVVNNRPFHHRAAGFTIRYCVSWACSCPFKMPMKRYSKE